MGALPKLKSFSGVAAAVDMRDWSVDAQAVSSTGRQRVSNSRIGRRIAGGRGECSLIEEVGSAILAFPLLFLTGQDIFTPSAAVFA